MFGLRLEAPLGLRLVHASKRILRAEALSQHFACGLRHQAGASAHARKAAQNKTGAYSPPRFSAPALKVPPVNREEPGRSSTFGQLVRKAKAGVQKAKWMKSPVTPRCLAPVRWVNEKGGHSIYLVDNKQGGIDSAGLMYTVPNSNYCRVF